MRKNTFLCRKDPFEIPGGTEPISDLFKASAKQVPPLRNQTTGDLWESPQVYYRSCFGFGVSMNCILPRGWWKGGSQEFPGYSGLMSFLQQ